MATAAVYTALQRVKNQSTVEQAKRDLAMAKYERRLTRMENRQLNLLEDLENYEAMGTTAVPRGLFKAALDSSSAVAIKDFNIDRQIAAGLLPTEVKLLEVEEEEKADGVVNFEDDRQVSDRYDTFDESDDQIPEEEEMEGSEYVGSERNSDFDTLSWIKKNGDNGFLTDLSFLKDLKDKRLPNQEKVRLWYLMRVTQIAVAVFIILNFLLSAVKAQRQPQSKNELYVFEVLEIIFALIFAFELAVNMYGSWCRPFFESGWNWFDLIIVLISLFTLGLGSGIPGINTLRLFRAFRVIRLFKRIPSLKRIVEGVIQAIPGVSNALIVLTLIMAIWSILGVEFYSTTSPENFGTFFKGMFSMFQCMTLDSWSGIARPLIKRGPMHWFFFCSYVLIAGIIMVNVVVAVLLEKFIGATGQFQGSKWGTYSAAKGEEYVSLSVNSEEVNKKKEKGEPDELAMDDMMMDRLLFLEMEFVRVNDKLDALISSLLNEDKQKGLQEELERERSQSFLRTRTGKLAMHRARAMGDKGTGMDRASIDAVKAYLARTGTGSFAELMKISRVRTR